MKKREITKIVHSLMVAGLAACLLAGCGNAKTESSSDTAVEETTDAEAATESEAAENEAAEEQSDANAEALAEENSSTETTDTDTTDSSDEAEKAEPDTTAEAADTASDPGEVTYVTVTDFTSFEQYMDSLDPEKPAIVIYNNEEGYMVNMQEGQHYQMKKSDELFFNFQDAIGYGMNLELVDGGYQPVDHNYTKANLHLDKFTDDQEFYVIDPDDNKITCYLTPPSEQ